MYVFPSCRSESTEGLEVYLHAIQLLTTIDEGIQAMGKYCSTSAGHRHRHHFKQLICLGNIKCHFSTVVLAQPFSLPPLQLIGWMVLELYVVVWQETLTLSLVSVSSCAGYSLAVHLFWDSFRMSLVMNALTINRSAVTKAEYVL